VVRVHRELQQDGKYREEGRQNNTILLTNFFIPEAIQPFGDGLACHVLVTEFSDDTESPSSVFFPIHPGTNDKMSPPLLDKAADEN
jgi:hypothetical protein